MLIDLPICISYTNNYPFIMLWFSELSFIGIGLQRMIVLQKTAVKRTIICALAQSNYKDTTIGIFDSICGILDGFL
jgi:hypothetical protein